LKREVGKKPTAKEANVQLAARPARPEKLGWLVSLMALGNN